MKKKTVVVKDNRPVNNDSSSRKMMFKAIGGGLIAIVLFHFMYNSPLILQIIESILQYGIQGLIGIQTYLGEKRMEILNDNLIAESRQRKVYSSRNEEICPSYSYRTRLINRNPMIIYIENFLSQKEIDHVISLGESLLKPSMINNDQDGSESVTNHRTSTSAYINRHQTHLVRCLERRFVQFQGISDVERLEPFQLVKYIDHQQYKAHFDWFAERDVSPNGGQRVSTFFSYLRTNCTTGGETEFLNVRFNQSLHQHFCDILVCDKKSSNHGIRFRPISGNSVFWYNTNEYGQVDYLTHHTGLPPGPDTYKIGLNTWTRTHHFHWTPVKQ